MPLGFLAVFSEPGSEVGLEEFQEWYDDEHVPLRLNHLHSFLSGARYRAVDGLKPSWIAVYDVDDTSTFEKESYTRLRTNRSIREAQLIKRLELLDRRTCEVVFDTGESELSTSLKSSNPTKFLCTHGMDGFGSREEAIEWAESLRGALGGLEGWVRSRLVDTFDSLRSGLLVGSGPEEQIVPKYLMIHEFLAQDNLDNPVLQKIGEKATDVRRWHLYRAFPGIAQGNLRDAINDNYGKNDGSRKL